ncbi:MAG: helix-turn-helix domain-containing protein [Thermomicrobiales bacterium]
MNEPAVPHNEIDDYVATFSPEERQELALAEMALDLAYLLHRAREERGLSQAAAAALAGLQQQAVSRFEQPRANLQLGTLQRYLVALGYTIDIAVKETESGRVVGHATLPPAVQR